VRPFQGVKVTLEQNVKAQRGSQGIRLLFNFGARWGWVINATPRPFYPRERDPVPIVQEAVRASGPVWTGAENLAFIGFQSPDRPPHSESLFRLSCPAPFPVSRGDGYALLCFPVPPARPRKDGV
jgi:hypothetical protein